MTLFLLLVWPVDVQIQTTTIAFCSNFKIVNSPFSHSSTIFSWTFTLQATLAEVVNDPDVVRSVDNLHIADFSAAAMELISPLPESVPAASSVCRALPAFLISCTPCSMLVSPFPWILSLESPSLHSAILTHKVLYRFITNKVSS